MAEDSHKAAHSPRRVQLQGSLESDVDLNRVQQADEGRGADQNDSSRTAESDENHSGRSCGTEVARPGERHSDDRPGDVLTSHLGNETPFLFGFHLSPIFTIDKAGSC